MGEFARNGKSGDGVDIVRFTNWIELTRLGVKGGYKEVVLKFSTHTEKSRDGVDKVRFFNWLELEARGGCEILNRQVKSEKRRWGRGSKIPTLGPELLLNCYCEGGKVRRICKENLWGEFVRRICKDSLQGEFSRGSGEEGAEIGGEWDGFPWCQNGWRSDSGRLDIFYIYQNKIVRIFLPCQFSENSPIGNLQKLYIWIFARSLFCWILWTSWKRSKLTPNSIKTCYEPLIILRSYCVSKLSPKKNLCYVDNLVLDVWGQSKNLANSQTIVSHPFLSYNSVTQFYHKIVSHPFLSYNSISHIFIKK